MKLPAGNILIPAVASHADNIVEHPERVANRIITFAEIVGQENIIGGTDAAWAAASIRKSPGPSSAPCATARRTALGICLSNKTTIFSKLRVVFRREPFQSFQFFKRSSRYVFGYSKFLVSRLAGGDTVSKDVSFIVFCRKLVPWAQRSRDDEH